MPQPLTDLSDTYRRLGGDERAGRLLHDAHVLARQCRANVLDAFQTCGAGEGEFDDPGHNPAHSSLSDAEQRVAALAAEGNTNREISRKLYITVSTVEQHLTKIYRKLNVKRFDLKLALQDLDREAAVHNGALALGQVTLPGSDPIRGHESRGCDGESLTGRREHGYRSRPPTDLSA
ncbi:helix-turn-helix domain-containing protein [Actinomadura scrupuli]|uniref:helix-turn-helix domain-containing protein n=1 Tax=Actinomadura scrupuli TaxID=559629 RepID=UPI003D9596C6